MSDIHTMVIPENVELKYEIAGIGSRFIALLLDTLIQILISGALVVALIAIFGFNTFFNDDNITDLTNGIMTFIMMILLFIVNFGYHIVLETTMNGQTIGKKAVNIRVRKEEGQALTFWDILLRNFIRLVDMLPSFYIIGFMVMFVNNKAKRLGDFAAGTIVVTEIPRKRLEQFLSEVKPETTGISDDFSAKYPWVQSVLIFISQSDYLIMKDLLSRRTQLTNFNQLASQFINKFITKAALTESITTNPTESADVIHEMVAVYERTYFIK